MSLIEIFPALAALAFAGFLVFSSRSLEATASSWMYPAALSVTFLIFSVVTIFSEGLFGFWHEHTQSLWGNQVWFDLLLAIGITWHLLLPEARALGMRATPWIVAICLSGCIGLLVMYARLLYLRNARGHTAQEALNASQAI